MRCPDRDSPGHTQEGCPDREQKLCAPREPHLTPCAQRVIRTPDIIIIQWSVRGPVLPHQQQAFESVDWPMLAAFESLKSAFESL
jgi:hypothetical protein